MEANPPPWEGSPPFLAILEPLWGNVGEIFKVGVARDVDRSGFEIFCELAFELGNYSLCFVEFSIMRHHRNPLTESS